MRLRLFNDFSGLGARCAIRTRVIKLGISFCLALACASPVYAKQGDTDGHAELVHLFNALEEWRQPFSAPLGQFDTQTMAERGKALALLRERLDALDVSGWAVPHKVDYLAVRSRFDQQRFRLEVSRPWARDPGFYVDQLLRLAFVELPMSEEDGEHNLALLEALPGWIEHAIINLVDVAADYADLALHNLSQADGVGHGHPYRAKPPAGVLGWYEDLRSRAQDQADLLPAIDGAHQAVQRFYQWLNSERPGMKAAAGVGRQRFDWYLRHVKLMPYDIDGVRELGKREFDRLWAAYALERHRNRAEPPLAMAESEIEYGERIARTDQHVRAFLEQQDILSIPDWVGTLDTNAPWIVRPGGPNFWEQVQYRDPHPDHLHAVIPGHRFDRLVASRLEHPIRQKLFSGARAEGWGVYLEEAMLQAGLFEDLPRVRELIYVFGIFRAARVAADVGLQTNQLSVNDTVDYWMQTVPLMDRDVARVDAEIYLRRPPGYGLGYTIGMLQMQQLLADRKQQLGDAFELRGFHDEFLSKGWLPISLIRWEMTGLDDEVADFWNTDPLP